MRMPTEDSFSGREKSQSKGPEVRPCLEQQGGQSGKSRRVWEERADRWQVLGLKSPECQPKDFALKSE